MGGLWGNLLVVYLNLTEDMADFVIVSSVFLNLTPNQHAKDETWSSASVMQPASSQIKGHTGKRFAGI
jgi:hypothetical protein